MRPEREWMALFKLLSINPPHHYDRLHTSAECRVATHFERAYLHIGLNAAKHQKSSLSWIIIWSLLYKGQLESYNFASHKCFVSKTLHRLQIDSGACSSASKLRYQLVCWSIEHKVSLTESHAAQKACRPVEKHKLGIWWYTNILNETIKPFEERRCRPVAYLEAMCAHGIMYNLRRQ